MPESSAKMISSENIMVFFKFCNSIPRAIPGQITTLFPNSTRVRLQNVQNFLKMFVGSFWEKKLGTKIFQNNPPAPQGPKYQKSYSKKIDQNNLLDINPHRLGMILAKKKFRVSASFGKTELGALELTFLKIVRSMSCYISN